MTFKVLTDETHNLLFCCNPCSTEEAKTINLPIDSLCGVLYPFIKYITVRDEESESYISIDDKPPLVSREYRDNENMT